MGTETATATTVVVDREQSRLVGACFTTLQRHQRTSHSAQAKPLELCVSKWPLTARTHVLTFRHAPCRLKATDTLRWLVTAKELASQRGSLVLQRDTCSWRGAKVESEWCVGCDPVPFTFPTTVRLSRTDGLGKFGDAPEALRVPPGWCLCRPAGTGACLCF